MTTSPDALQIQRQFTLAWAHHWAASVYKRLPEYEAESNNAAFNDAANNYSRALWAWVMESVPADLLDRLNSPHRFRQPVEQPDLTMAVHRYLFRRAWFLAALKYDQRHDWTWYDEFLPELYLTAAPLKDTAISKAIADTSHRRRLKKAKPDWGQVRYRVLLAWLAGGVWTLHNDPERAQRVTDLCPECESVSAVGFRKARREFHL